MTGTNQMRTHDDIPVLYIPHSPNWKEEVSVWYIHDNKIVLDQERVGHHALYALASTT